jgi:NADPH-dependent 2,4-dienoyl-CoA reductase/sulfur reductase-like enzyme
MSRVDRRAFLLGAGGLAGSVSLGGPFGRPALAQAKPKVVVIGGGPGGATVAKYIAKDSAGAIEVTLVEPAREFTTCFFSNLYLGGLRSWESITHRYDALASKYKVTMAHQMASAIDRDRKIVRLADGTELAYDRVVVAPGIDLKYDSVPGYSEAAAEIMPHAWKAGPQTKLLKAKLDAVPDGGLIVMVAPPNPYRCPPGPYERASMMAHALRSAGKTNTRIVILDPKDRFSKMGLFQEGWEQHYPGMIEWQDPKMHGGVKGVDPGSQTVTTDLETYKADLVNVIPAQMAGRIARDAGLANQTGFCPIDPASMRSAVDPNVYVIGDSCIQGDMPKSGFAANSQAKVAAMSIRGELAAARTFPARYANTCWSLITPEDAVKVGGRYEPAEGKIKETDGFISQTKETPQVRKQTLEENLGWYAGITSDIFS